MTKTEFLRSCAAHVRTHGEYVSSRFQDSQNPHAFVRVVETGGVSGGSCWDSSNPQPYSIVVTDPGLGSVLDSFLEAHFPSISFLHYRRLTSAVQVREDSESAYYGNRTDYAVWSLSFEEAWAQLEAVGLVS